MLLAITFWGVSFVATKAAVDEIAPLALVFSRSALGVALLAGVLLARGEARLPPRETWRALALMGFVGVFVHQTMQAYALRLTSAANTGWLIGLTPLWSALLAAVLLRERLGPRKLAGLALGCAGALVVITGGRLRAGVLSLPATRGDLLILASTLNWSLYTVLGHPTLKRLGARTATTFALLAGCLMLLPFFLAASGWHDWQRLSPRGWAAVVFLGFACSGLGYLFWYAALEKIPATEVAAFLYLEPLVTAAAAAVLIGEPIRSVTVLGGLLVSAGVLLVQKGS